MAPTKYKDKGTSSVVTQESLWLLRRSLPSCVSDSPAAGWTHLHVPWLCTDSLCQGKLQAAEGLPVRKWQPVLAEQGRPLGLEKSLSPEADILQPLKWWLMCAGSFALNVAFPDLWRLTRHWCIWFLLHFQGGFPLIRTRVCRFFQMNKWSVQ